MKTTPMTVYTGLAFIGEEYIDIYASGSALDLSSYDLQLQCLDEDDAYAVINTPTVRKDTGTTGRIWPEFTAAETTALSGKNAIWILLLRPTDLSQDPRPIGYGRIDVEQGTTWQ